jgi:hypothetical protein
VELEVIREVPNYEGIKIKVVREKDASGCP